MSSDNKVPALIRAFFAADLGVVAAYVGLWAVGGLEWDHGVLWKVGEMLDINGSTSIATWYSSVQLFVIAGLLATLVYSKFEWRSGRWWTFAILPIIFAALSFEQLAHIHEWLAYKSGRISAGFSNLPNVPYSRELLPLLLIVGGVLMLGFGYLLKPYFAHASQAIRKYVIGFLLSGVSAIGLVVALGHLPPNTALRVMTVSLGQLGEMVGVTVMLWATHDLMAVHQISLRFAPTKSA